MASDRKVEFHQDYLGSRLSIPVGNAQAEDASSSKPTSPAESPKVDWQFLNFSHPSEAKTSQHRKKVRSHVTKQQHQREQALTAARKVQSHQPESRREKMPAQPTKSSSYPPPRHSSTSELSGEMGSKPASPVDVSQSPSPMPSPTSNTPKSQVDPADIYPEAWQAYLPHVMEHYLSNMAIDIPNMSDADTTGLLRSRFFPFIFTDPAPMHAVSLVAASHYSRIRGSRSHAIDLLQLRGMAIREVNGALVDGSRGTSNQIVAAVAMMATYETLFGDREVCNTHMQGLTRIVSLRGGLPGLGLDGLLERIVLWVDSNVSHIMNRPLYFNRNAFPPSASNAVHPTPNPSRFAAGKLARRTP